MNVTRKQYKAVEQMLTDMGYAIGKGSKVSTKQMIKILLECIRALL